MYTVLSTMFLIATLMLVAGFVGRIGTSGFSDVSANVASALGLIVTYAFLVISVGSFTELAAFFEGICGGIPYLSDIADYGSLKNLFEQNPLGAAVAFMDTVILSAMINLLSLLPWSQGEAAGKFMVDIFTGVILAIISLFVLNNVIKELELYHMCVTALGGIITVISAGTLPLAIIASISRMKYSGIGFLELMILFSQSKVVGILRDSVLKAAVYVVGIWYLERNAGSIANGLSTISAIGIAFGPVVIMLIGLVMIVKSALR